MPEEWTWGGHVLRHLMAMLGVYQPLIGHEKTYRSVPDPLDRTLLEWSLPMGFDDGVGCVRLTLVNVPAARNEPLRVRVVVAAGVRGFTNASHDVVPPRYGEPAPAPHRGSDRQARDMELTWNIAAYLLKHIGGDPQSLSEEADGSMGFTV